MRSYYPLLSLSLSRGVRALLMRGNSPFNVPRADSSSDVPSESASFNAMQMTTQRARAHEIYVRECTALIRSCIYILSISSALSLELMCEKIFRVRGFFVVFSYDENIIYAQNIVYGVIVLLSQKYFVESEYPEN